MAPSSQSLEPPQNPGRFNLGNIRDDEEEQFKKAVKVILALTDEQVRKLIEDGQFEEVKKDD